MKAFKTETQEGRSAGHDSAEYQSETAPRAEQEHALRATHNRQTESSSAETRREEEPNMKEDHEELSEEWIWTQV